MFQDKVRHLATEWNLSIQQLAEVTGVEPKSLENELNRPEDTSSGSIPLGLENIATLIGLHDRLTKVFPQSEKQQEWLDTSNPHFDGLKPMDVIRTGIENTQWISYYLETILNFQSEGEEDE